jgi:peptidoglycan/xylan/chitin deacetylase (PgdA/CDA1 family)
MNGKKSTLLAIGVPALAAAASLPFLLGANQAPPHLASLPVRKVTPLKSKNPGVRLNQAEKNIEDGLANTSESAMDQTGKAKIAYLTFDDGPCPNTKRVLATLAKNKIKATFFVVGRMAKQYPDMLRKEYAAGHAIGNHSYTHDYKLIYRTPWTMIDEFVRTEDVLEQELGETFRTKLFRFPGGFMGKRSVFKGHKEDYAAALGESGLHFIDWNVDCGDTHVPSLSKKAMIRTVMSEAAGKKRIVVLMHDVKERTADALPSIIAGLKKKGFTFRTLE